MPTLNAYAMAHDIFACLADDVLTKPGLLEMLASAKAVGFGSQGQ